MHLLVESIKYELLSAGSGYQVKDDLQSYKFRIKEMDFLVKYQR